MFIIKQTYPHHKNSKTILQVFKLLGKWGAISMNGSSTPFGFQYSTASEIFDNLIMQKCTSYELLPGPTIRISAEGSSIVWKDYFQRLARPEALDEDSWKILSPTGKKYCVINLVYLTDNYLLIDNETGDFICYLSSLDETLQKKFLELCEKYKVLLEPKDPA